MKTENNNQLKIAGKSRLLLGALWLGLISILLQVNKVLADPGDEGGRGNHMFEWNTNYTIILVLAGVAFLLVIAFIISQDATNRGQNGLLWGLLVFFMPMMGIVIYLIYISTRPPQATPLPPTQRTSTPQPRPQKPQPPQYVPTQPVQPTTTQPYTTPKTTKQLNTNTIYCTTCGAANQTSSKYCKNCGTALPPA